MFLKKVKFLLIFSTWLSLGFLTLTSEDMIITFLREHCEGQANILSVLDFFFGWSAMNIFKILFVIKEDS